MEEVNKTYSVNIKKDIYSQLQYLTIKRSNATGYPISITILVREAITDLINKYDNKGSLWVMPLLLSHM